LFFKSISDLQGQSKKILVTKYNPFFYINKDDAARIDELFCIRNYLSHYSDLAERRLHSIYKKHLRSGRFREPGHFLMTAATGDKIIRISVYLSALDHAAKQMRRALRRSFKR